MQKPSNFQAKMDVSIERMFLWAFPKWVRPNYLTYFRIATIPFIFGLMYLDKYILALVLFVISASTDFLDGTMARRRDQVTDLGKIIDPIADKMLIAVLLFSVGYQYLIVKVFLVFMLLEIIMVASGAFLAYRFGKPVGANIYGKIKMMLQTVSVFVFLAGVVLSKNILITISVIILLIALIFALLAGFEVYRTKQKTVIMVLKRMFK
jgi:CDP-diacylglycerol--glycerol-3-phosphate 3-phosphatidyltransferase